MKKLHLILILLIFVITGSKGATFNITDFGATVNQLSTAAIQKTVDHCFENGGGIVLVPAGTFITGTIFLKSNIELHLEAGATLEGSKELNDYTFNGEKYGIIFCEDAENVSISGKGTIYANGSAFYDFTKNHTYDEFEKSRLRQKENYMPADTFFTDGPVGRVAMPGMTLVFFHCNNISITGITIKDTPVWATRFGFCDGLLIDGITIQNNPLIPNSDGIHCTVSRNIRISNCNIAAGDDAIVLTGFPKDEETPGYSSKEQDKFKNGNKTLYGENLVVTNCVLKSSSSGIRIGYGQHPIRRCTFNNIVIYDSHRGIGIFAHDASNIEELVFSNITIETRLYNGQWWGHGEPIHLSCISRFEGLKAGQIKNVQFNNIVATGEQGILLYGLEKSRIENISFNNVQLRIRKGKETLGYGGNFDLRPASPKAMQMFEHDIPGLYAQCVDNLSVQDFTLIWDKDLPSFFSHGIECNDVTNLFIEHFSGDGNPNAKNSQKVKTEKVTFKK